MLNLNSSLNKFLVEIDSFLDYIPIVSTVSNLIDIFQKKAIIPHLQSNKSSVLKEHYFCHINSKDSVRCVILLVPFLGNALTFYQDFFTDDGYARTKSIDCNIKENAIKVLGLSEEKAKNQQEVVEAYESLKVEWAKRIEGTWRSSLNKEFKKMRYQTEIAFKTLTLINSLG
jgi:hypothetical protein